MYKAFILRLQKIKDTVSIAEEVSQIRETRYIYKHNKQFFTNLCY